MAGILKEENQITAVQQMLKFIIQENFPEIKDDFKPQIKRENLGKLTPKRPTLIHSLVNIWDLKEIKGKNLQGIQVKRQFMC